MITGENIAHSRVLRVPVYRSQIYCRRREVEKELTGKDTEPSEIIYFKLYKSQIPVVERATEIAGLMLGTDNRGAIVWRWSAPIFWRELVSTEPIPTCYFIHSFDSSNSRTKSGKRRSSPK